MQLDMKALSDALAEYGYADVVCRWPTALRYTKNAEPWQVDIRIRFMDYSDDPKVMRQNLLAKYEAVWELLTERFGLRLQDHPTFEIRGRLMYHVGSQKPTPAQVYAEASYDCWIP